MPVTENSIPTSLHELREIEQERISDERAARARDEAAREQLVRDSIQRQIAEAEARRETALAEAARQRAAVEAEQRTRDTAIACAEAEARVRAEAELASARLAQEMELRHAQVARTRPIGLVAVIASLVLGAGGLGVWIARQSGELDNQRSLIDGLHGEQAQWKAKAVAYDHQRQTLEGQQEAMTIELTTLRREIDELTRAIAAAHKAPAALPPATHVPHVETPHGIVIDEACTHSAIGDCSKSH